MKAETYIHELENERAKLEESILLASQRLKEIRMELSALKKGLPPWNDIIYWLLQCLDEPLMTSEILDEVLILRKETENPVRRRHYMMQLSSTMNRLVKYKKIYRIEHTGIKRKFYALSEWTFAGELKMRYQDKLSNKIDLLKNEKRQSGLEQYKTINVALLKHFHDHKLT